jgi:indole-3-glycerol phosphate synthase
MDGLAVSSTPWRPSAPGRPTEVGGFLDQMALGSHARMTAARAVEPLQALRARCADLPPPPALAAAGGFDLIAELKLRSPALGDLGAAGDDLGARIGAYARAGAAAVSVLTEPSRFSGSLAHLETASVALAPLGVPAMRKDFLVDPYQLYEARACGAGGALLIVRMLSGPLLVEMLDCARELGLFVLIETFDEKDIATAVGALPAARLSTPETSPRVPKTGKSLAGRSPSSTPHLNGGGTTRSGQPEADRGLPGERVSAFRASGETPEVEGAARGAVLLGVNSRDLQTLQVVPERLEQLAPLLPVDWPRVAESGLKTAEDAARMVRAGYDMALVGGALMSAPDPGALVAEMLAAGRAAAV